MLHLALLLAALVSPPAEGGETQAICRATTGSATHPALLPLRPLRETRAAPPRVPAFRRLLRKRPGGDRPVRAPRSERADVSVPLLRLDHARTSATRLLIDRRRPPARRTSLRLMLAGLLEQSRRLPPPTLPT